MTTTAAIPGYIVGTWDIDPLHSDISITARHFMVSKVRGTFTKFEGQVVTAEDPLNSSVTATIQTASIDTKDEQRDAHIRAADFLDVDTYPTITFRSTGIRPDGDSFLLDGELTLRDQTRPITLNLEVSGFGPDAFGGTRAGFSASTAINRSDYGMNFNAVLETGGAVLSDKLQVTLDIEGVLRTD